MLIMATATFSLIHNFMKKNYFMVNQYENSNFFDIYSTCIIMKDTQRESS